LKRVVFTALTIIALLILAASCTQITAPPNFSVIDTSILGAIVTPSTASIAIDDITIENNTTVATKLDRIWYQYILNGTVLYNPAGNGDTLYTFSALLDTNTTYKIINIVVPFDSIVNDYMFTNDIQSITLRLFISGVDNYGYNKRYTTSTDFSVNQ